MTQSVEGRCGVFFSFLFLCPVFSPPASLFLGDDVTGIPEGWEREGNLSWVPSFPSIPWLLLLQVILDLTTAMEPPPNLCC